MGTPHQFFKYNFFHLLFSFSFIFSFTTMSFKVLPIIAILVLLSVGLNGEKNVRISELEEVSNCTYTSSNGTSTYDLSPLHLKEAPYWQSPKSSNNSYYLTFNICGAVDSCGDNAPDKTAVCQSGGLFPSYYSAGVLDTMVFTKNKNTGVIVNYQGGETCENGFERSTSIHISCSTGTEGMKIVSATEPTPCNYQIYAYSKYACSSV